MKKFLAVGLAAVLSLSAATAQDKEKKTYELIYQDVQLLKLQYQKLEKKVDAAADEIAALGNQIRDLTAQFKLVQTNQAQSLDGLKSLPLQIQAFLERLAQIESDLLRVSSDLSDLKAKAAAPPTPSAEAEDQAKKAEKTPAQKKPGTPTKKEPAPAEKKGPEKKTPSTTLSIQDAYNVPYVDYQKGNFDLAIAGFKDFIEQFPDKILTDDAVYMIGECYYSQKKYDKAIEQFDDIIVNYAAANSNQMAAAYLKKGYALAELKRKDEAIAVLRTLIAKFPIDEEAKAAQEKIKELQTIK